MSKKQIGIICIVCICLAALAMLATPLFAKKSGKAEVNAAASKPAAVATVPTLAANRVYVMYVDSCPMCAKALQYLDEKQADNPFIERVDLNTEAGKALLKQCRQKFGFKDVVIPLICADKEYSMGWSGSLGEKIEELTKHAATVY